MSTPIEFSPFLIFYGLVLLVLSLGFWYHDATHKGPKRQLNCSKLSLNWTNFGVFICFLFLSIYVLQNLVVGLGLLIVNDKALISIVAGLSTHIAALIYILCLRRFFPSILGTASESEAVSKPSKAIAQGIYYFFAGLPLIWASGLIWSHVLEQWKAAGFPIETKHQELVELFSQSHSTLFVVTIFLFATLIAPITEEFVFRRTLYRFFKQHFRSKYALLITAVLFSLSHMNLMAFLPLLTVGLLLGRAYERTGSLLTSITVHSLFNLNTLLLLLFQPKLIDYTLK